jgi:hypothetical protein
MRSFQKILPLCLLWLSAACAMNLRVQPEVPQINTAATRWPGKVAVLIPAATRDLSQTALEPSACWGVTKISPQPYGQVFAETLRGILGQYFENVVTVENPPAPADARLVLEASLEHVSIKLPCGISPAFFATAQGSLRALGPDGSERWRVSRTSQRNDQRMPMFSMEPYHKIVPETIASLVSGWATELSMAAFARAEGTLPAAGSYKAPPASAAGVPAPVTEAQPAPAPQPAKVYSPDASWDNQLLP